MTNNKTKVEYTIKQKMRKKIIKNIYEKINPSQKVSDAVHQKIRKKVSNSIGSFGFEVFKIEYLSSEDLFCIKWQIWSRIYQDIKIKINTNIKHK